MNIATRVENILRVSSAARNSDTELIIIYMQKSGMELTPKQIEVFKKLPSLETITRVRRQLQEQGKYEASEKVQAERYHKAVEYSVKYGVGDAVDPIAHLAKLGYTIVEDE